MKYEKLDIKIVSRENMTEEEKEIECIELIKTLTPEQLIRVRAILNSDTEIKIERVRFQTSPFKN